MIDTHCHVHFRAYKDDMDEVIVRSLEKGVRMITVGTQSTTSKNGVEVAEKYDGVYTTIGLHPNHTCEQHFEDELEEIKTRCESFDVDYYRELAKHPKVVAIAITTAKRGLCAPIDFAWRPRQKPMALGKVIMLKAISLCTLAFSAIKITTKL